MRISNTVATACLVYSTVGGSGYGERRGSWLLVSERARGDGRRPSEER